MSSRAYQLLKNAYLPLDGVNDRISFNYTHSPCEDLLRLIGRYMPFDNGGIGVPLVIYREEVNEMKWKLDNIAWVHYTNEEISEMNDLIRIIEEDMKACGGYVLYHVS